MTLYFHESGDTNAPLMVFLHGGGVSSWMWDKQIEYFQRYHCVAIDLPEQGRSKQSEPFSIKYSAEKVMEMIESLANGKQVIIIGFSLGAQVTVQMLSINPNLIDNAIINSALVRPNSFLRKSISPSIKLTYPLIQNKTFSKLQAQTLYIDEDYFEIYYQESSQMKRETLIRILEENMSFSIPHGFRKAKGNILVTVGDKEKAIMKKSAQEIVENNVNCIGAIIPDVGHGISLQNPDYFNQMIEHWLEKGALPSDVTVIK